MIAICRQVYRPRSINMNRPQTVMAQIIDLVWQSSIIHAKQQKLRSDCPHLYDRIGAVKDGTSSPSKCWLYNDIARPPTLIDTTTVSDKHLRSIITAIEILK